MMGIMIWKVKKLISIFFLVGIGAVCLVYCLLFFGGGYLLFKGWE